MMPAGLSDEPLESFEVRPPDTPPGIGVGIGYSPAGIIILVLFLVLAAAAAAVVVYKGWAKPIARSVAMWVLRGDKDLSAHMRHHDSARAGSTAPVQAAGSWQHPICGVPCKEALPRMTEVKEALAVGTARTAL